MRRLLQVSNRFIARIVAGDFGRYVSRRHCTRIAECLLPDQEAKQPEPRRTGEPSCAIQDFAQSFPDTLVVDPLIFSSRAGDVMGHIFPDAFDSTP